MEKTSTTERSEDIFKPKFWFYYDPWVILHPQTPLEAKLKTALKQEASFFKSEDLFWLRYGGLLYPAIGTTVLSLAGYLLGKSVEKLYINSEFAEIDAALKKEQQLLQNLPPKRALKFMPRAEVKKYDHLINLDKSGPAAFDKFETLKKEILVKSNLRLKAIVGVLAASGLLHGFIRSRVSFYNFSKAYEKDLCSFEEEPLPAQKP